MVIVEIIPNCVGEPIRFACVLGDTLSDTAGIIISYDDAIGDMPRYLLHISCRKADIDFVSDLISPHYRLNGKPCGQTLAENRKAFCVKGKSCPLRNLTIEELLLPITINELAAYKFAIKPHWND